MPRTGSHEDDDPRDQALFKDLAAGRLEALGRLYDAHAAALFRHALALTRCVPDAEDLVQAVFMKLVTTGADLLGVRKPVSYLHWMLHTTWLDTRRRIATGERAVEQSLAEILGPHTAPLEDAIDVARALDELPPLQREVIVLHIVEGVSFREIGRLTGVSLFTAAARYRLALGRLRNVLSRGRKETT